MWVQDACSTRVGTFRSFSEPCHAQNCRQFAGVLTLFRPHLAHLTVGLVHLMGDTSMERQDQ